ncbi:MAG: glycosyltransferase family 4 protein [Burkholderiales bacterium]|jgi:glycosyltransferase involved in cell wall biosynthesis|nr:glycosyltransferase family 4 protein [Betaproteobacteria bacterium]
MNTHGVPEATEVTVVVLITGQVIALSRAAKQLLFDLRYYAERDQRATQIRVVLDGPHWREQFSTDDLSINRGRVLGLPTATEHPGQMLNSALDVVVTDWVAVLGIGSEISTWYANLAEWHKVLSTTSADMVAGYRSVSEGRSAANESYLVHQNDQFSSDYPHAWLQMLDLVPMSNTMTRREVIRQVGGFTEAESLQRMWWWEFCLRVSRSRKIESIQLQPVPGPNWHQFSFSTLQAAPPEISLQRLMQLEAETRRMTPAREDELNNMAGGIASLSALHAKSTSWRMLPTVLQQSFHRLVAERGRPLEIMLVGGVNEPAHNQLCFFNYFAQMRSWRVLNWRAVLDERATAEDLEGCDLVIFSRVRSANGVALMRQCTGRRIRTMYMLDDNWFWLGREWDEYAHIFSPGAEPYENFLTLVGLADIVLTYRDPLANDLRPHAKRVVTLPTNVDLRVFPTRLGPTKGLRRKKIGYVGSLRKNMVAFEALVKTARSRNDVDIFVMSNSLPDEFVALPAERVHFEPYQFNYNAYAATVVAAAPDVLVAPVGRTRFEESKCPNKYLEISAAGAAGVYSRAEPYTSYVRDGVTGLFADDTVEAWTAAIARLLEDEALRTRIASESRVHVSAEFDTVAVLPQFVALLVETMRTEA